MAMKMESTTKATVLKPGNQRPELGHRALLLRCGVRTGGPANWNSAGNESSSCRPITDVFTISITPTECKYSEHPSPEWLANENRYVFNGIEMKLISQQLFDLARRRRLERM